MDSASEGNIPPAKKMKHAASGHLFEATTAGAVKEVSLLHLKFAEALSERAADDSAKMKELDRTLADARQLECFLKQQKTLLKDSLALISRKLLD